MSVEEKCLAFITENLTDSIGLFTEEEQSEISNSSPKPKAPTIEPIPIESFDELVAVFKKSMFWTQTMEDVLAVMLAVLISVKIGGELLWIYIVGPPSSGKSALCDAVAAASTYAVKVNKITGIHSGYKKGKSKKDYSVLHTVNGKTMIVKDWTSILSLPPTLLQNIYGELRDIYDGSVNTHYRTEVRHNYDDVRFGMLAGVTYEILRQNFSHLGERCLRIDITDKTTGSHKHVSKALEHIVKGMRGSFPSQSNAEIPPDRMLEIKQATLGFLNHLFEKIQTCPPPEIDEGMLKRFTMTARLMERLRGHVAREGTEREVSYRPRPAVAIRLASQLTKTAVLLSVVFDKPTVDEDVFKIIKKLSIDSSSGPCYDIIKTLMAEHEDDGLGLSAGAISKKLGYLSKNAVHRRLQDLQQLKLISPVEVPNKHGVRGRHSHLWQVIESARVLWNGFVTKN